MGEKTEAQPVASWVVRGFKVFFPVQKVGETGGNRLVERERPYRDGAKLDDTGSKARRWNLRVEFVDPHDEPGLEGNGDLQLYPDVLNLMLESFRVHETGDLTIPREGTVRARAESYSADEEPEGQDSATVVFVFVEDNEDKVGASSFKLPAASANARRLAEATTFDQDSLGNGHFSVSQLQELVSRLEGLVNEPFEFLQELEWTANRVVELAKQTKQVFSRAGVRGRDQLLSPRGSRVESKLVRSQDMAGRAAGESRRGRPQVVRYVVQNDTSVFLLAAFLKQEADELMLMNPQLESVFFIPKGTEVKVFTSTGAHP